MLNPVVQMAQKILLLIIRTLLNHFLPALNGLNLLLHRLRPPSQHHSIPTPVCAGRTVVDLTYQQLTTVPTQQIHVHVHVDDM